MRTLFVGLDAPYASSNGSTANTATTPDLLYSGSIGIYGIDTTTGLFSLITTSSTYANYRDLQIYQGGTSELIPTGQILCSSVKDIQAAKYVAPVKQVAYIGYDTASGLLNLPTIAVGDSGIISYNEVITTVPNQAVPTFKTADTGSLAASASGYACLTPITNQFNDTTQGLLRKFIAEIVSNGTATTVSAATSGTSKSIFVVGAGTPAITGAITNGTTSLVLTLASSTVSSVNFVVGDYIQIAGTVYKVAALGSTGAITYTITIDRAFQGTTLSAAAASNFKFFNSADPTQFGLKMTAYNYYESFTFSRDGIFEDATITYTTNMTYGIGSAAQLSILESRGMGYRGAIDTFSNPNASPKTTYINTTTPKTYDVYTLNIQPSYNSVVGNEAKSTNGPNYLTFAFEVQADTAGKNQADFEDILLGFATANLIPSFTGISA
jgi:hypothetical protein